jgi:hypothetical protein
MLLKRGPYGHYLQLGDGTGDDRPKRVSLPPGVDAGAGRRRPGPALLDLPRVLGTHPETASRSRPTSAASGPTSATRRCSPASRRACDVLSVDLATALDLLANKRGRGAPRRTLGDHPEDGEPVTLHDGKYGPYVKHGKVNASLPEGADPDALTLDEAVGLLEARAEAAPARGRGGAGRAAKRRRRPKPRRAKAAPKKAGAQSQEERRQGCGAHRGAVGPFDERGQRRPAPPEAEGASRGPPPVPRSTRPGRPRGRDPLDGIGRPKPRRRPNVAERLGRSEEDLEARRSARASSCAWRTARRAQPTPERRPEWRGGDDDTAGWQVGPVVGVLGLARAAGEAGTALPGAPG